jgi:hypothetical protein
MKKIIWVAVALLVTGIIGCNSDKKANNTERNWPLPERTEPISFDYENFYIPDRDIPSDEVIKKETEQLYHYYRTGKGEICRTVVRNRLVQEKTHWTHDLAQKHEEMDKITIEEWEIDRWFADRDIYLAAEAKVRATIGAELEEKVSKKIDELDREYAKKHGLTYSEVKDMPFYKKHSCYRRIEHFILKEDYGFILRPSFSISPWISFHD